jgi:hypothetical protein
MAYKDGTKSGGKKKGSRNKKTILRIEQMKLAAEKMANEDGSRVFAGDAHALLMTCYKNEDLPIEFRARCAEAALKFEKPALQAVDSSITERRQYVVEMPAQPATLDDWMRVHARNTLEKSDNQDPTWEEKLKRIRAEVQAKQELN